MPTILLIEDEEKSIDLLSLHLSGAGFAVEVARDGQAGLESVRKLRPAGIVLDIVLPELDGWDVLAALKADPELADIPVIVVSMLDERGKGFALGASEYLVKPVGRREVQNALERCVHGGGVASRTVLVRRRERTNGSSADGVKSDHYTGAGERSVGLVSKR